MIDPKLPSPWEITATVNCQYCGKQKTIIADTKREVNKQFKEAGWMPVVPETVGIALPTFKTTCPECIKSRALISK